jgi:hypothetical protein
MRGLKQMKKRITYVLAVLLIVLALLMTGCTVNDDSCESIEDQDEKDQCFHEEILETEKDLWLSCENIVNQDLRETCFLDLVDKKYVLYDCEDILLQDNIDECYLVQGANMKYEDYCDRIHDQESKDYCYSELVEYFRMSKGICEKMLDAKMKNQCLTVLQNKV